jgi:hypothetical protein
LFSSLSVYFLLLACQSVHVCQNWLFYVKVFFFFFFSFRGLVDCLLFCVSCSKEKWLKLYLQVVQPLIFFNLFQGNK